MMKNNAKEGNCINYPNHCAINTITPKIIILIILNIVLQVIEDDYIEESEKVTPCE